MLEPGQQVVLFRGMYGTVIEDLGDRVVVEVLEQISTLLRRDVQTEEEYSRWAQKKKQEFYSRL